MKTTIKFIITNIIWLLVFIFLAEIILTCMDSKTLLTKKPNFIKFFSKKVEYMTMPYFVKEEMRNPAYKNSNLEPVLLVGCSRTHGYTLPDEHCFHTILSNTTNRTVYNLGLCGGSLKEVLYILRSYNKEEPLEKLTDGAKNIKYVIYIYQRDHKYAIDDCKRAFACCPRYKYDIITNELKFKENGVLYNTEIYRNLKKIKSNFKSEKEITELFALYVREVTKEVKKLYGEDAQFIIVDTCGKGKSDKYLDKVNLGGAKLIKMDDITHIDLNSPLYHISARDPHPNRKAWDVLVPALVKELNL